MNRRDFMKLVAAVGGTGAAVACGRKEPQHLLPYLVQPRELTPGIPRYYATACAECGAGCGVLAKTREGRTVKLEGNPEHPGSRGSLCALGQAAVQGLYHPDRPRAPLVRGPDGTLREASWDEALARVRSEVHQRASAGAAGRVAFLTGDTLDSDADLVDGVSSLLGWRAPVNFRVRPDAPLARAARALFGYDGMPHLDFAAARLVVSVGADFLETWGDPVAQTRDYTKAHSWASGGVGRSVYAGPRQSNTAAACDEYVRLLPGREAHALRVVAETAINRAGRDYEAARAILDRMPLQASMEALGGVTTTLQGLGRRVAGGVVPLVVAGGLGPDAEAAHLLALLITHVCGGADKTLRFPRPARPPRGDALSDVGALLDEVRSGGVEVLLTHECDPAHGLPGAAEALAKVPFRVAFTTRLDDTAAGAHVVLPIHHPLETWGDQRSSPGVVTILQPAQDPLFPTRAFGDLVLDLARSAPPGPPARPPAAGAIPLPTLGDIAPWFTVRHWEQARLAGFRRAAGNTLPEDEYLRRALRRGVVEIPPTWATPGLRGTAGLPPVPVPDGGTVLHAFPHPYLHDGRGADKPWLQEVHEVSTAATWGSWVEVHPDTAKRLGCADGDDLVLSRGGSEIRVPVLVTAQAVPYALSVPCGQGHGHLGRWAAGLGANPLRLGVPSAGGTTLATSGLEVQVRVVPQAAPLARTAGFQDREDREIARAVLAQSAGRKPEEPPQPPLNPPHEHKGHLWGMVVDLDRCVGCGACMVACYAENNLPVVGAKDVIAGREMAWLSVQKHARGDDVRHLPMLCQHCEQAPCEPVCPVSAAYHTEEGLNGQVYNRCVGTRQCNIACPYKVRRFNGSDHPWPSPLDLQYNPDVTVRERGVMEKCTFCVQRIRYGKDRAKVEGRRLADGEIVPACAQTCPADVFVFGDLNDPQSRVARMQEDPRGYRALGDQGTRPKVLYLKKVTRSTL